MLKGADISKWQGQVNFDLFRDAVQFLLIRSSYGVGYEDTTFIRNRDEARRVGIPCGFYHYAYPNNNTPEAEADFFLKTIGTPRDGEILCLDFEEAYTDPVGWSLRFLDRVTSRLNGYKPLIYLNLAAIKQYDWSSVVKANYGLWLAYWDYNATIAAPVTDWPVVALRQWSNHEIFPGITGNVDANTFYGTVDTFKAYGYSAPVSNLPPADQFITAAVTLLRDFQNNTKNADGSLAFGNVESAMRGLTAAYTDLLREKDSFRTYKEAEAERVSQTVTTQVNQIKAAYEAQVAEKDKFIQNITSKNLSELPWSLLLSWGWKNFWKAKKGVT